jgi:hypothetical protein
VATGFHLDNSSPLRKKWNPLGQVLVEDGEAFSESEPGRTSCLAEEVVLLSLLKVVMTPLLEGLDSFNRSSCMICPSVGGLYW